MEEITVMYRCQACGYPHSEEFKAERCCPPEKVYTCPAGCGEIMCETEQEARDHCR